MRTRLMLVLTVLAAFTLMIFAPLAAQAGSTGRRNTAIAAAAITLYLLVKGKTVPGLIAGAGTYYAYKKYKDARNAEKSSNYYRSHR